jgi:hypothetical protein
MSANPTPSLMTLVETWRERLRRERVWRRYEVAAAFSECADELARALASQPSGPRETGSSDVQSPASGDGSSGPECVWTQDEAGNWRVFCRPELVWGPITDANVRSMKFCPYCGKPLKEAK